MWAEEGRGPPASGESLDELVSLASVGGDPTETQAAQPLADDPNRPGAHIPTTHAPSKMATTSWPAPRPRRHRWVDHPWCALIDSVLDSEEKTTRAERLLGPMLRSVVATVVGVALIVALLGNFSPWSTLVSALGGVTAVGGSAVLVKRWRRKRPQSIDLPEPRGPS